MSFRFLSSRVGRLRDSSSG